MEKMESNRNCCEKRDKTLLPFRSHSWGPHVVYHNLLASSKCCVHLQLLWQDWNQMEVKLQLYNCFGYETVLQECTIIVLSSIIHTWRMLDVHVIPCHTYLDHFSVPHIALFLPPPPPPAQKTTQFINHGELLRWPLHTDTCENENVLQCVQPLFSSHPIPLSGWASTISFACLVQSNSSITQMAPR